MKIFKISDTISSHDLKTKYNMLKEMLRKGERRFRLIGENDEEVSEKKLL